MRIEEAWGVWRERSDWAASGGRAVLGIVRRTTRGAWGHGGWAMSMGAGRVGLDLFAVLKGGVDREIAALSLDVRVIGLPCPIRRANRTVE